MTYLLHTGNLMLLTKSTAIILMNLFKYEFDPPKNNFWQLGKCFFLMMFFINGAGKNRRPERYMEGERWEVEVLKENWGENI